MKKQFLLLVCFFSFLLSSCGRANDRSDISENSGAEAEYQTYNDFRTDVSDEVKIQYLEQEIKDMLVQSDDISDAEVSILRTGSGCEVNVNLIYSTERQNEDSILKSWAENLLSTVLTNEENLTISIN